MIPEEKWYQAPLKKKKKKSNDPCTFPPEYNGHLRRTREPAAPDRSPQEAPRGAAPCQAQSGPPGPEGALTWVGGGAPADGEDLAQVLVLLWKALLQPLQLAQALAALVLHGAHVLDEVQLGLGGVAAQDAVVVAALALHAALVLLQVL